MSCENEVCLDGVDYIRQDMIIDLKLSDNDFVIIRTYSAGVFAGYLKKKSYEKCGVQVVIDGCRRLYRWSGAMTLEQIAGTGIVDTSNCKFTEPVNGKEVTAIEIIPVTNKAKKIIDGVPIWKK